MSRLLLILLLTGCNWESENMKACASSCAKTGMLTYLNNYSVCICQPTQVEPKQ